MEETLPVNSTEDRYFRAISYLGIQVLSHLDRLMPLGEYENRASIIITLAIFTDERDRWTTHKSAEMALSFLSNHAHIAKEPATLIDHILRKSIRPLFSKSKNPSITAQGRKAILVLPTRFEALEDEKEIKPWKYEKGYIITVFRWALQNLDVCHLSSGSLARAFLNRCIEISRRRELASNHPAASYNDRRPLIIHQSERMRAADSPAE